MHGEEAKSSEDDWPVTAVNDNWNGGTLTCTHPGLCVMETSNPFRKKKKAKNKKQTWPLQVARESRGLRAVGLSACPLTLVVVAASYNSLQTHEATQPLCLTCLVHTRVRLLCIPSCYCSSPPTVNNMLTLPSPHFSLFTVEISYYIHTYGLFSPNFLTHPMLHSDVIPSTDSHAIFFFFTSCVVLKKFLFLNLFGNLTHNNI